MCKACVLRFCCGHGVLMGFEPCRNAPCPIIKTTGTGLPQQPYKCYNCQHKLSRVVTAPSSSESSCETSIGSVDSTISASSMSSYDAAPSPIKRTMTDFSHPLPGVARQPKGCVQYTHNHTRSRSYSKPFRFCCASSNHWPTPHYSTLPGHLPHQTHPCPPCQLQDLREEADREVTLQARKEYPHLRAEMLVRNGRVQQPDCLEKMTLEKYIDEKRTEERQMWLHVSRKWTQDLKKARVLVAEEDGLGLLG